MSTSCHRGAPVTLQRHMAFQKLISGQLNRVRRLTVFRTMTEVIKSD